MVEKVLILGAGIAGLNAALALHRPGREVIVIDRDAPPPETSADEAFDSWDRRGVGHVRHSHAFLARLHNIIRDNYPELLKDLLDAGCREIKFYENMPVEKQAAYVPVPGDADLTILTSRRTTLELVMRRYVARQPGVTFMPSTLVRSLILEQQGAAKKVLGVNIENADGARELRADIIVDAAGKNSQAIEWLREAGATISETSAPAGIVYFTRHYRLHDGVEEPKRTKAPGAGDLGYIKFGIFPADNGCFSVTLAVPEVEMEIRRAVVRPEIFDGICAQIPGMAPWVAPETSAPKSKVFGMGELWARWRSMVNDGAPVALNFFPMGDAVIRTNPLYGRGCSFAAVQAHVLADALDETSDPVARALSFHAKVEKELRPYYNDMLKQDASAIRRAANALDPDYKPTLKAKLIKSFADDAIMPAARADIKVLRDFMRGFHMIDEPGKWIKDWHNVTTVLRFWLKSKKAKEAADLYPPKLGPDREDMLNALGISASADMERLKAAA
ncbi:MAG: FAD-binding protein [Parvibaculum sp.]|nr:FAD-binding protein [Parvibaculum sp.]